MVSNSTKSHNISRRTFIHNSAALVGGSLISPLTLQAGEPKGSQETLKLALVGCGGRGTGAAVQALKTEGPAELVAMADVFRDKLDNSYQTFQKIKEVQPYIDVPEEHKFIGFNGYKKAIDVADVVILATPPGFRPFHFEKAVQAGKHVFMEKPLACDAPGIRKILQTGKLAENKGLSVVVGLQYRYDKGYQALIKRLQDGAIGDILSAKCNYLIGRLTHHPRQPKHTELEFQMRNWHYFNWLWAGAPAGLSIHYTDLVHWAKGSYPVRAQGVGGRASLNHTDHGDIFDNFYIEYEYDDGTKLHSEIRYIDGCWTNTGATFQGTGGTASMRDGINNLKGETRWEYDGQQDLNPYQTEHDKFFASIRSGTPINDTERSAMSNLTSIMGRMAVHSGKTVERDQALNSDLQLVPENLTFDSEPPIHLGEDGKYPIPIPGQTTVF